MPPRNPIPSAAILPPPPDDPDQITIRVNRIRNHIPFSLTLLSTASPYFSRSLLTSRDGSNYLDLSAFSSPTVTRMLYFIERDSFILSPTDGYDEALETSKTDAGKLLELVKLAEEVEYPRLRERAVGMLVLVLWSALGIMEPEAAREVCGIEVSGVGAAEEKDPGMAQKTRREVEKWVTAVVEGNEEIFVDGMDGNGDVEWFLERGGRLLEDVLRRRREKRRKPRVVEDGEVIGMRSGNNSGRAIVEVRAEAPKKKSMTKKAERCTPEADTMPVKPMMEYEEEDVMMKDISDTENDLTSIASA